jgi:mRNA interferase HigB
VNVISRRGLVALEKQHPEAVPALERWYRTARKATWLDLNEVRRVYPSADQVGNVLIFDVSGGNYRLITVPIYRKQRLYIKALLRHREYDRGRWLKWA